MVVRWRSEQSETADGSIRSPLDPRCAGLPSFRPWPAAMETTASSGSEGPPAAVCAVPRVRCGRGRQQHRDGQRHPDAVAVDPSCSVAGLPGQPAGRVLAVVRIVRRRGRQQMKLVGQGRSAPSAGGADAVGRSVVRGRGRQRPVRRPERGARARRAGTPARGGAPRRCRRRGRYARARHTPLRPGRRVHGAVLPLSSEARRRSPPRRARVVVRECPPRCRSTAHCGRLSRCPRAYPRRRCPGRETRRRARRRARRGPVDARRSPRFGTSGIRAARMCLTCGSGSATQAM